MAKRRRQQAGAGLKERNGSQVKDRSIATPRSKSAPVGSTRKGSAAYSAVPSSMTASAGNTNPTRPVDDSTDKAELQQGQTEAEDAAEDAEGSLEDYAELAEETNSILAIVKDLESQVDTAFKLKEVLETHLEITQEKLAKQMDARAELEARVESLEAEVVVGDQLRQDISFVEEERNKFAKLLEELHPQLDVVTEERDSLVEKLAASETTAEELEEERLAFEAQVMNLKDKVADTNHLRSQLAELTEVRQDLDEQVETLSGSLEAANADRSGLETELGEARQTVGSLGDEAEDLRDKLADANSHLARLRAQLEQQQAANNDLREVRTSLEGEFKISSIGHKAAKKELNAVKKAMRGIREEAALTSGRVRQRYLKSKTKG